MHVYPPFSPIETNSEFVFRLKKSWQRSLTFRRSSVQSPFAEMFTVSFTISWNSSGNFSNPCFHKHSRRHIIGIQHGTQSYQMKLLTMSFRSPIRKQCASGYNVTVKVKIVSPPYKFSYWYTLLRFLWSRNLSLIISNTPINYPSNNIVNVLHYP